MRSEYAAWSLMTTTPVTVTTTPVTVTVIAVTVIAVREGPGVVVVR